MRYVKQRHPNGCVSAAVAMVTGLGYDKIFRMFNPKRKSRYDGVSIKNLLEMLTKLGVSHRRIKREELFHKDAIIAIEVAGEDLHAVVWDNNRKLLDPGSGISGFSTINVDPFYCYFFNRFIIEIDK